MTTLQANISRYSGKLRFESLFHYFSLTKPRLSSLVIFTSAMGLFLAPGSISLFNIFVSVISTSALVGGACVINCLMEKEIDALMERTKDRPLPSGKISSESALIFGVTLILLSLITLFVFINPLTAFLGLFAAFVYIALYTPLKRKTSWALFAGAIPGAIPPLMGWTSVTNSIDQMGLALFGLLFIWQLPHFLSISIYRVNDYNNAEIKTYPANIGFRATQHRIVFYTGLLSLISLAPYYLGVTTINYFTLILLMGLIFTFYSLRGYLLDVESSSFLIWARKYFYGSLIYLPVTFIFILFFKTSF